MNITLAGDITILKSAFAINSSPDSSPDASPDALAVTKRTISQAELDKGGPHTQPKHLLDSQ